MSHLFREGHVHTHLCENNFVLFSTKEQISSYGLAPFDMRDKELRSMKEILWKTFSNTSYAAERSIPNKRYCCWYNIILWISSCFPRVCLYYTHTEHCISFFVKGIFSEPTHSFIHYKRYSTLLRMRNIITLYQCL